jgi:N-glycosylase/DNA lyase
LCLERLVSILKQIKFSHFLYINLLNLLKIASTILYGYHGKEVEPKQEEELKNYFQLNQVSLEDCYQRWSKIDPNFAKKAIHFQGIRMLRQDPWENLISFICSSNNNITRISQMIDKLCKKLGNKIAELDEQEFYDFPTLDALVEDEDTEKVLRELGFGYRAKYIANTAEKLKQDHPELGEKWLNTLRDVPYTEAKESLMELQGVK